MRSALAANDRNTDFLGLDKEVAKLEKFEKQLKQTMEKGFSSPQEFKEFQNLTKQIGKSIQGIDNAFDQIDATKLTKQIKDLKQQINEAKVKVNSLTDSLAATLKAKLPGGTSDIVKQIKNAAKLGEDYTEVQKRINANLDTEIKKQQDIVDKTKERIEEAKKLQTALEASTSDSSNVRFNRNSVRFIDSGQTLAADEKIGVQNKINTTLLTSNYENLSQAVGLVRTALQGLGVEFKNEDTLSKVVSAEIERLRNNAELSAVALNNQTKAEKELGIETEKLNKIDNQRLNIQEQLNSEDIKNSYDAIIKEKAGVEALDNQLTSLNSQTRTSSNIYEEWRNEVNAADIATEGLIDSQKQLDDTFGQLSSRVSQILSIGTAYQSIRRIVRQTYEDVKEIDKAFGEIAMVTSYSVADMWEQYDSYAKMANELGQTTVGVIQASGLYYQQGLQTNEVLELTEETMKLATLAGLDFADATSQMTAAIRGFDMEMSEGQHVTDVYAELAAHAAADVQGIATAMSKTAAIAKSAGMSFDNTAVFLTTMIEATQEAPDNIGTALKAVTARFQELKENVAGTADSAFDDLDYNKVDKALKSVGISIKDATGQFRNLDDVFLELGEKWSTLDRNSQRYRVHSI